MIQRSHVLAAIFPETRLAVLSAAFEKPERWWCAEELAASTGLAPTALRREIAGLSRCTVLRHRKEGSRIFFQADPKCPIFGELKALLFQASLPDCNAGATGSETILVVEDEPATLRISRILLESWGYKVLPAGDAEEAIRVFEHNSNDVALLLTDVVMPKMRGPELVQRLRRIQPRLKVVYMSGYAAEELSGDQTAFLPKPFSPASLARMVREALDR